MNINAYHDPEVEAGKMAARSILESQRRAPGLLSENNCEAMTCADVVNRIGRQDEVGNASKICQCTAMKAMNPRNGLSKSAALDSFGAEYEID